MGITIPLMGAPITQAKEVNEVGTGAWSYFGDTRALEQPDGSTAVGYISPSGDAKLRRIRAGKNSVTTLHRRLGKDDHNNPSLVRFRNRLVTFYSPHAGRFSRRSGMFYRISKSPYGKRGFGPERQVRTNTPGGLGMTYPNPVVVGSNLFLFWRGGNWQPSFSKTRDLKRWSPAKTLIQGNVEKEARPYVKYAGNGRKVSFIFNEGHPYLTANSIWYAEIRKDGFYKANGQKIKSLSSTPLKPEEADLVYPAQLQGSSWVQDIAHDRAGRPVAVFSTYPSFDNSRYWYARHDGTKWTAKEITRTGGYLVARHTTYVGGISLNHDNPSELYLSRQTRPGVTEIEKWSTPDGGASWNSTPITQDSQQHNMRPVAARGSNGKTLFWMRGAYDDYQAYRTKIVTKRLP